MTLLLLLALTTATVRPASPAVGDLVTIEFAQPAVLDASDSFEVVSTEGNRVVVRTFAPQPFKVSGRMGALRFRDLTIRVHSVLRPNDDLKPAPLTPPRAVSYPRRPFVAIAIAALAACVIWGLVWWRSRAPRVRLEPEIPADERYRRAIESLRTARTVRLRWATLADETRRYLAATRTYLGAELTTREVVSRLAPEDRIVETILRQGDLEKFSTEGARPLDFEEVAIGALRLAEPRVAPAADEPGEAVA